MKFVLLALLTIATLVVFWWIQPENRLNLDPDTFQVEDLNTISKVELVSSSAPVTLTFEGGRWRVNDQYHADGDMIRVLFATLQQAKPKRAVASLRRDSIYQHLEISGIRVSLFERGELKKQFLAGGNSTRTQAFFADPASREVFVMTIPGYRVYVSGILELTENEWRDKFVFGFNWRNFKSLEAEFAENPSENFTVSLDRDQFVIRGLPDADTARLHTFLDDVSLLTVNEYISEPVLRDSLLRLSSQMQIKITDAGNRTYGLQLYEPERERGVFGIIQDAQLALFDQKKITPILKPKSFFTEK